VAKFCFWILDFYVNTRDSGALNNWLPRYAVKNLRKALLYMHACMSRTARLLTNLCMYNCNQTFGKRLEKKTFAASLFDFRSVAAFYTKLAYLIPHRLFYTLSVKKILARPHRGRGMSSVRPSVRPSVCLSTLLC
jgi:hypothetical protein